jgi:hypothetical protein
MAMSSDVVVAGGLLEAIGELSDRLTVDAAVEQLRGVLSPSALWEAAPIDAAQVPDVESRLRRAAPRWDAPTTAISERLQRILDEAWTVAVADPGPSWGAPVLRLVVGDLASADALRQVGSIGARLIVPQVEARAQRFSWQWPIRIGVAPGPHADQWRAELEGGPHSFLYTTHLTEDSDDEGARLDVLFVDADARPAHANATCVVIQQRETAAGVLAAQGRDAFGAAVTIGVTTDDASWFDAVVREMAHDQPIDVATTIVEPDARIIADPTLVNVTAARQWALALSDELDGERQAVGRPADPTRERLRDIALHARFDAELNGATEVATAARELQADGIEPALEIRLATAAARPPDSPPAPAESRARRVIADAYIGDVAQKRALQPATDHMLVVKIAVPTARDTAADVAFPEGELPKDAVVDLTVHATSGALGLRGQQIVKLLTTDRAVPSTPAAFAFRTPAEPDVVDIQIVVEFKGRPLQEAHYLAPVRARPVPGDSVDVRVVPLSSSSEPRPHQTDADVSLVVNGANLERTDGSGTAFDLGRMAPIVDAIERVASAALGVDGVSPDDPEVRRRLLVELARIGTQLHGAIESLELTGNDGAISIVVDPESPVVPLELVYEAAAPRANATVCPDHPVPGRVRAPASRCTKAGPRFVCPTAFWGQRRVVARTVRLHSARPGTSDLADLSLRPVLFAAAKRADADLPPNARKPSDVLAESIAELVGGDSVTRVSSWTKWRDAVRSRHPQMLVVLGHTELSETGTETTLEIGGRSRLASASLTTALVHTRGAPPPLVVLMACASAVPKDPFGTIAGEFVASGAGAVVASLTKLHGPDGALAAAEVVRAIVERSGSKPMKLGAALTAARRRLVARGNLVGLLLVSHGEIDLVLVDI